MNVSCKIIMSISFIVDDWSIVVSANRPGRKIVVRVRCYYCTDDVYKKPGPLLLGLT